MQQMNIFDYIEKSADVNVVVQKAPEKPPRELTQYELLARYNSNGTDYDRYKVLNKIWNSRKEFADEEN